MADTRTHPKKVVEFEIATAGLVDDCDDGICGTRSEALMCILFDLHTRAIPFKLYRIHITKFSQKFELQCRTPP